MSARSARTARRALAATALAACLAVLCGCSPAPSGGPRIAADRFGNGISDPISIAIVGARPGEDVVLTAQADTSAGTWSSRAIYAVPPDGTVRLWSQQAVTAPWVRPDGGAPLWSMTGPSLSQHDLERAWAQNPVTIRLTAEQAGRRVAATAVHRSALAAQSVERDIDSADLLGASGASQGGTLGALRVGRLFSPLPALVHRRPAVIVVDGDEGGASGSFVAARIAELGFPVFVLPAFGPEGQIPGSAALSVDAFDAARAWLAARPGVDPGRIVVYGTGRAAPLALWFAAEEPGEVYGAIAAGGPTALLCTSTAGTPVLYSHGRPVPCASPDRTIADTPILPLARIPGPVLLACGTADQLLPSACDWQRAGEAARGRRGQAETLYAIGAAHEIATPALLPIGLDGLPPATAQATEDARTAFWSRVTALLEEAIRS
ncbi:acyl-CoA thioesterase/BAAT N-terminal domain-containing protein [Leifsonia sp. NPDC080035]|uniref:Acyl-CoA thioesterase/BAAT N-terminal domain-containing protein n=1 Tax=Leifsonia sp. NPDC080035 TaxID=3143936 RepID=A0AAU7G5Q8_9MICO